MVKHGLSAETFYGPATKAAKLAAGAAAAFLTRDNLQPVLDAKVAQVVASTSTQTELSSKTIEKLKDNPSTAMNKKLVFYYRGNGKYKGTGEFKLYWNTSDAAEGKVGKQMVNPLNYTVWQRSLYPSMFSKDFILGTGNNTNGNLTLSNDNTLGPNKSIFTMDPNFVITGTDDTAADPIADNGDEPDDSYIRLKYVDEFFNIHNSTDCSQYVQIYFFICKKATNKKPLDFLLNEFNVEQDYRQVDFVYPDDNTNVKDGAGAMPNSSNALEALPNVPLSISRDMRKYWGLFHMESVVLSGNEEIKYKIKHIINRTISKNNVQENEGQFIPGLTILPMILCQGVLGKLKVQNNAELPDYIPYTDGLFPSTITLNATGLWSYTSRMYHFGPVTHVDKTKVARFASTVYQRSAYGPATSYVNAYTGVSESATILGG